MTFLNGAFPHIFIASLTAFLSSLLLPSNKTNIASWGKNAELFLSSLVIFTLLTGNAQKFTLSDTIMATL